MRRDVFRMEARGDHKALEAWDKLHEAHEAFRDMDTGKSGHGAVGD